MKTPYWVVDIALEAKEIAFISAYLEAIDFTETGDTDQPDNGTELCTEFMRESIIDCLAFYSRIRCYLSDDNIEQAGHDFWFTRNGHGVGYWDRPEVYGEYTDLFTRLAKQSGTADAYFEDVLH
jgi:hypothetical protein